MRVNYHTHTYRCFHADGTEEDYVVAAIENGLNILGISDHAPFKDADYGYRMHYEDFHDYLNAIDTAKEKYKDKITVYKSLEIEFFKKDIAYYEELLTKDKLDYLILGAHQYKLDDGTHKNIFFADSTEWYLEYANTIKEALNTGYFKYLAHPDLCMVNQLPYDKNCDKAFDIILDSAVKNDVVLEFNANGLRRGISEYPDGPRYPYPHEKLWSQISGTNIKVIVGSDCHNPTQVWDEYVDTSYKMLKEYNITPTETFI